MDKYSDILNQNELLSESIDDFLKNFSNIISFDEKLKLHISRCYLSGSSTPQIKKKLLCKKYPPDSEEAKILSLYLKPDCNKLYRIRKKSNPEGIIKMIQLKNLCTYILQKYPTPDLAGLPFDFWNAYRLKVYICLLFHADRKQISKKTISNILSANYNSKGNTSKDKLPINIGPIKYYLYIRICKSKMDRYQGKRKYNRCIYAALFCLSGTDYIYTGRSMSKLYFARKKTRRHNPPTLYKILDQLLGNEKKSNSTIYIGKDSLATFRIASFHALESRPTYNFILFNFNDISDIEKKQKHLKGIVSDDKIVLEKMKDLIQQLNEESFSYLSQKKDFLTNMSKKIKEFCGDC